MQPEARFALIEKQRIKRLYSWYLGEKQPPLQIDVELHKICNLRCLPCSRQSSDSDHVKETRKYGLKIKGWLELVDQAADLGVKVWNIEGANEPLAKPKLLIPVLKRVKERGMFGILTTNGTLWTEEQLKSLVDIGWDRIHFSIDGHKADLHDHLRGKKGAFVKTIRSVKILNEYKKERKSSDPMINFNVIINKRNYKHLVDYVEFAHTLGCSYIFTEPLMLFHNGCEHLRLDQEDRDLLPSIIENAKTVAYKHRIDNNFYAHGTNLDQDLVKSSGKISKVILDDADIEKDPFLSSTCFKPFDNMAIKFDGLAGHCGLLTKGDNVKEKSLSEIWYGRKMKQVRKDMLKKKLFDHCHKCCPSDITYRRRLRDKFRALNDKFTD